MAWIKTLGFCYFNLVTLFAKSISAEYHYYVYELDTEEQDRYPWSRNAFMGNWFDYYDDALNLTHATKKYLRDAGFDPENLRGAGFYSALDGNVDHSTVTPENKTTFPTISLKTQGVISEILLVYYISGKSQLRVTFENAPDEEIDPCSEQSGDSEENFDEFENSAKFLSSNLMQDPNAKFLKICSFRPDPEYANRTVNIVLKSWLYPDFILVDLIRINGHLRVEPTPTTFIPPPLPTDPLPTYPPTTTETTTPVPSTTVPTPQSTTTVRPVPHRRHTWSIWFKMGITIS